MDLYAVRILRDQPLRLSLTVGGIALCIVLMLFLMAAYRGVADGSLDYIRRNRADLWVLQRNASNILRGSSVLFTGHGQQMQRIPGVKSASPVLLILSTVRIGDQIATVFLTGYDVVTGVAGPPDLVAGRHVRSDDEIVLDKAFTAKYGLNVDDRIQIQDTTLQVVGVSSGTNAFVIQYAFVTLQQAQSLIGIPSLVTCYLIRVEKGQQTAQVAAAIREALPEVEVYNHPTFLQNNVREVQSGFLPFIYTVASLGVVVLTAILSLLLSINVLEKRKDFALLKTLGASRGFLSRIIVEQALLIATTALIAALGLFFPLVRLVERFAPEVTTKSSVEQVVGVAVVVGAMSILSAFISMQRLRWIYPMEAFS
ncbi:MAG: ABC transporter permease [Nitrospiraceae bacterium]